MATKIFIDNEWVDYDYSILYNTRGYTNTPSTVLTTYDSSHTLLESWLNSSLIWIEQDHRWYPINETPYYVKQDSPIALYKIDSKTSYTQYLNNGILYVSYGSSFYTQEYLHDTYGITSTPSTVWDIDEGTPWCWYNPVEDLYWNDKKKAWSQDPPNPEEQEQEDEIIPFPDPIYPYPQWEYDLSQIPTIQSVTGNFYPVRQPTELITAFDDWSQWEVYQNVANDGFYPDITYTDITLYVYPPDGADDYQGTHYPQGSEFTGDYQEVWVDSDADVPMYRGAERSVFGTSHDDVYPLLYYVSIQYFTPSEMHSFGYTLTEGENVEIFDANLLPVSTPLWDNPAYLYFTPNGTSTAGINIPANTPVPLYYLDGTQVPYNDLAGSIFGPLINKVYYNTSTGTVAETPFEEIPLDKIEVSYDNGYLYFSHSLDSTMQNMVGMSFNWGGIIMNRGSLIIGQTDQVPSGTTKLYSRYWWSYDFNPNNATNWDGPNYYSTSTPPSVDSDYRDVPGSVYNEVYMTSNADNTLIPTRLMIKQYSSKPDVYFNDMSISVSDRTKTGIIIAYGSDYPQSFELPSSLYTISGTAITWNTSHTLYKLLYGKPFTI